MNTKPLAAPKPGRPQSIPPEAWAECFRLYSEGHGYRAIADLLVPLHVSTTKSSVERLIKGRPPYRGRRARRKMPAAAILTPTTRPAAERLRKS